MKYFGGFDKNTNKVKIFTIPENFERGTTLSLLNLEQKA